MCFLLQKLWISTAPCGPWKYGCTYAFNWLTRRDWYPGDCLYGWPLNGCVVAAGSVPSASWCWWQCCWYVGVWRRGCNAEGGTSCVVSDSLACCHTRRHGRVTAVSAACHSCQQRSQISRSVSHACLFNDVASFFYVSSGSYIDVATVLQQLCVVEAFLHQTAHL